MSWCRGIGLCAHRSCPSTLRLGYRRPVPGNLLLRGSAVSCGEGQVGEGFLGEVLFSATMAVPCKKGQG